MTKINNAIRRASIAMSHTTLALIVTIGYQPESLTQTVVRVHTGPKHVVESDISLQGQFTLDEDSINLQNILNTSKQSDVADVPVATVIRTAQPAPGQLEGWFNEYGQAFNVNPELLKSIAKCESGYNQNAVNGPYGGMYQYLASTWSSTRNAMGADPDPSLRFNAKEAIFTTAWKISVGGVGPWPHCGRLASAQHPISGS